LHQSRLGLRELGARLRQLPRCLIGRRLKRPRVNFKQRLSFADERTFGLVLP